MPFACIRCHSEIDKSFKACPHCGEPVTDFLRKYLEEPVDGKYRILERLGAGGMGEVYKVEHIFLRAIRVIKVIRPQISETEDAHERFLREAQLATRIQHPNVATLHDFSELPDGSHYMVWEFIEGENLAQMMHSRALLPAHEAISLTQQALAGLEAIHRAGIVHRDISPENLMITTDGQVKIIDLGVAKSEEGDYAVTRTGIFVGKLRYASPEHLGFLPEGAKIDGRADLYSMAVVLVEMLTGKPPFEATSPHQYILHHSRDTTVPPLDLSKIPGGTWMQEVLAKALERDRDKRFATAREFSDVLETVKLKLPTQEDETVRIPAAAGPAAPTLRTPLPAAPTAAGTIRTAPPAPPSAPSPAPPPPAAPTIIERAPRGNNTALAVFLAVLVVIVAAAAFAVWHFWPRRTATVAANATAPAATATAAPRSSNPATATVDVAPPTATVAAPAAAPQTVVETESTAAKTTELAAATPPKKTPAVTAEHHTTTSAAPQPNPQPPPEVAAADIDATATFTEGNDSSRNDDAVAFAHKRLSGVTRVSLDARGDADLVKQLTDSLKSLGLTITDGADVQIRFYGTVKHFRFGRKQRSAEATIVRNGHPIFKYEMKPEEYRVGDDPAEAFVRVLSDLFAR